MNNYDNDKFVHEGFRLFKEFLPQIPFFIINKFTNEISWVFPKANLWYDVINLSNPPHTNSSAVLPYLDTYYYGIILNVRNVPNFENLFEKMYSFESNGRFSLVYMEILKKFREYYGLKKIK